MGQRLCIEIYYNDDICVANAYYRWGGYSYTALEMLIDAGKVFKTGIKSREEATILAVRMLEATGARMSEDEFEDYKKLCPSDLQNHPVAEDNPNGYISVSQEGMRFNMTASDEDSSIHIDEEYCYINFNVFACDAPSYYDWNIRRFMGEDQDIYDWSYQLPEIPFNPYDSMGVEEAEEILKHVDLDIDYMSQDHSQVIEMI